MEASFHRFSELFKQLGLPDEPESIRDFIHRHTPLAAGIALADAPFWTTAQAALLKEELLDDSDWIGVIDLLNVALRK